MVRLTVGTLPRWGLSSSWRTHCQSLVALQRTGRGVGKQKLERRCCGPFAWVEGDAHCKRRAVLGQGSRPTMASTGRISPVRSPSGPAMTRLGGVRPPHVGGVDQCRSPLSGLGVGGGALRADRHQATFRADDSSHRLAAHCSAEGTPAPSSFQTRPPADQHHETRRAETTRAPGSSPRW